MKWEPLAVALLSGGLVQYILGMFRDRVKERQTRPSAQDASMLLSAKSNEQLAGDNARLRAEIDETARRHALDRREWARERIEMRQEIDELERKLRDLLDELVDLKTRHNQRGPGQ